MEVILTPAAFPIETVCVPVQPLASVAVTL